MWIINCILLVIGTVAAVMGISFFWRNKEAEGRMRAYICALGILSGFWCISFGMIGITEDISVCDPIRAVGIVALTGFLTAELYLVSDVSGAKKGAVTAAKILSVVISLVDIIVFAQPGLDRYIRVDGRTTWIASPGFEVNRKIHSVYICLMFLSLLIFGIIWLIRNKVKRLRHFLVLAFIANFTMLFFSIPDTLFPVLGYQAVATSGIGGAICAIVMWYGATQLSSFDIRMGSIRDKFFDFIDAGVIVFDLSGRTALMNRYTAERMRNAQKAGYKLDDLFTIEGVSAEEVLKYSEDKIYAARFWDKENAHAYSVRVNGIKDNFDEIFCYMCVFIDVTEEVEAIRKFEVASEAKSRFLAQMSHEIRTPINAVLGMNEMILREEAREDILEYARNIDSAGKTLLTLINSILDFSKIEDGKMEIIPVRYDTASFVNDLVNSVLQRADAKGLAFEANIDEALPCALVGDDVRFSQVILNLLTNAVKYTPQGTVTFTMSLAGLEGDTAAIRVSVKDTGIGIKEEDREALFESFERLDEFRNHNIEGTGLGLSIIKSLLSLMDSKLAVESVYGVGSCFSFELRQKVADGTPIGDYKKRLKESYANRREHKTISVKKAGILVVDDNDMNLKVCSNLLKLMNIKPDVASSGMEAIECMKRSTYDIVLLDHMMPKMDGIETLKKLKEEGLVPEETTVIVLTANAVVGAREMYLEAGFDDYLSKPIAVKELEKKLVKYLPAEAFTEEEPAADDKKAAAAESGDEFFEFVPEEDAGPLYPGTDTKEAAGGEHGAFLSCLAEQGIRVEEGIGFAAGDVDFYMEMLEEFCRGSAEKAERLNGYFAEENMKDYEVLVHAMKSNAGSVGAEELQAMALRLEEAAAEGRMDIIKAEHKAFMDRYKDIVSLIRDGLKA